MVHPRVVATFSPAEQREVLARIAALWRRVTVDHRLSRPTFQLHQNRNWGEWHGATRVLSINAHLAIKCRWEATEATVRHEVAHQWAQERGGERPDEPPHGPTWRRGCVLFAADPRATAECRLEELTQRPERDCRIQHKLQRLLALTDSDNVHEAQVAALRAGELMVKHQVISASRPGQCRFDYRTLGKPMKRRPRWVFPLADILANHFQVETIWLTSGDREWCGSAVDGRVLEVTGTHSNVDLAAYTYEFLVREGSHLVDRLHSRSGARTRNEFLLGLYTGFRDKLDAQRDELIAQCSDSKVRAIVRGGDPRVTAFFRARYPRIVRRSVNGGDRGAAFAEGRTQGRDLVVRPGVTHPERRGLRLAGWHPGPGDTVGCRGV